MVFPLIRWLLSVFLRVEARRRSFGFLLDSLAENFALATVVWIVAVLAAALRLYRRAGIKKAEKVVKISVF